MFKRTRIDFATFEKQVRERKATAQRAFQKIVERDNDHQQAKAARGGTQTSTLSEGAEAAVAAIQRRLRADLTSMAQPFVQQCADDHAGLKAETLAAAQAFVSKWSTLRAFEDQMARLCSSVNHQVPALFAGEEANALAFIDRIATVERVIVRRQTTGPRQPLSEPSYADLVN